MYLDPERLVLRSSNDFKYKSNPSFSQKYEIQNFDGWPLQSCNLRIPPVYLIHFSPQVLMGLKSLLSFRTRHVAYHFSLKLEAVLRIRDVYPELVFVVVLRGEKSIPGID